MQPIFDFIARYMTLTEAERQIVIQANTLRHLRKNEILPLKINNQAFDYFVLSGCVCAHLLTEDGSIVVDFFIEGEPVLVPLGEEIELRCVEDSEVAVSSAETNERMLVQMPRFESVCRKFAEERMRFVSRFSLQVKALPPDDRYRFLLAERPQLIGRVPQYLLASYLGLTPETISRVRRRFLD